jgi:RNA 3'-phosphate cyclase
LVEIDGSFLEGGGQILRTSLALSAVTGKPFAIRSIRKARRNPGLRAQHLHAVQAAQQLCNAEVSRADVGSRELTFKPDRLQTRDLSIDIGTAGSITLLMQAILLPAVFGGRNVTITVRGGTDVAWSQPFDYFKHVLLPYIRPFGSVDAELERRGYYPRGGGEVRLHVRPKFDLSSYENFADFTGHIKTKLPGMNLVQRGGLSAVQGVSHAAKNLKTVAERQANQAAAVLEKLGCPVSIGREKCDTSCPGSGITLRASFEHREWPVALGGDSLGKRGKPAEKVGEEAADNLIREIHSGASVDSYLADQLLPWILFLPFARYKTSSVTDHCRTNMYVIEKFVPVKFQSGDNTIGVLPR